MQLQEQRVVRDAVQHPPARAPPGGPRAVLAPRQRILLQASKRGCCLVESALLLSLRQFCVPALSWLGLNPSQNLVQGAAMVREVHFDPVCPYLVRLRIQVGGILLRMTINGPLYLY